MARRHSDDAAADDTTDEQDDAPEADERGGGHGRRTFVKTVGATAAALALGGAATGEVAAADGNVETYLSQSGDVTIPAGTYSWSGSGIDVAAGDSLVGGGSPGDVVWNLDSGTMDGGVEGTLSNVVVRGANQQTKAGIDLYPGATIDGFVWPEGGQQPEDRAFYTPSGGSAPVTVKNAAWAWMSNNGAYTDKPAMQYQNCAAINNNITGIRVGQRDGTSESATTTISNCLIAVTQEVATDGSNSANARGIRMRHPGNFVIENCWFVYLDVNGAANPIEIHDGAAGSSVTIRDCHFYNDSSQALVRDKSNGGTDVTIENCTVEGSGSTVVEPSFSGSGVQSGTADYPLPSELTGYAAADEIEGVGPNVGPWDATNTTTTTTSPPSDQHTLVLHAGPDNAAPVDVSFTVDGDISFAGEAESGTDTIVANGDGTTTATSVSLDPDALDSYRYTGPVTDYSVPDGATVDVSLDGTATTFADLAGTSTDTSGNTTDTGGNTTDSGPTTDTSGNTTDSGSTGGNTTDSGTTTDSGSTSGTTTDTSGSTSGTTTDSGSTGGNTTDSASTGGTDTGTVGSAAPPNRISVDGTASGDVTRYTFTVSGSVVRDGPASSVSEDGTPWDRMEDIASDGKVIGLVGNGVDAYRFDGVVTSVTVDGDASFDIERGV